MLPVEELILGTSDCFKDQSIYDYFREKYFVLRKHIGGSVYVCFERTKIYANKIESYHAPK